MTETSSRLENKRPTDLGSHVIPGADQFVANKGNGERISSKNGPQLILFPALWAASAKISFHTSGNKSKRREDVANGNK